MGLPPAMRLRPVRAHALSVKRCRFRAGSDVLWPNRGLRARGASAFWNRSRIPSLRLWVPGSLAKRFAAPDRDRRVGRDVLRRKYPRSPPMEKTADTGRHSREIPVKLLWSENIAGLGCWNGMGCGVMPRSAGSAGFFRTREILALTEESRARIYGAGSPFRRIPETGPNRFPAGMAND